ncbi:CCA tRNA nucleotidyltransferase [uncultured Methanobrevibacter sp.]|uniref:CCA tRNA nucleotidyltransferase n=1 Tax=uncultured Methanobrevibacter sp. TaxID=253161 RepID=UPI00262E267E|nr:CCA tRNA nucleotidyltransferase [uncultured Methanobrevibacter sp.]
MDYKQILNEIKPSKEESHEILKISKELINYLNEICRNENIDAEASLVGSVAKKTYLSGKSDIDIFISFPLDVDVSTLKKTGLYLGYKCSDKFCGKPSEHYASHPYVTSEICGFEVDFVPCYKIENGSQLKSAVDRTILHTKYIKSHLGVNQNEEVLLLKRFMDMTGTYGSEFKVGGFAGYLCELLILKYGTFENTLKEASNWKYGQTIDLEGYNTAKLFNDPLIVIDPTDMNRNVGAALRLDKMAEFIQSARNYLNSNNKKEYFYPASNKFTKKEILEEFKKRGTDLIAIKFNIPDIPLDTLHPQLRKTTMSLVEKLNDEDFSVYQSDYWSDEENIAILLFEMSVSKLNNTKIHHGPKVFVKKGTQNFIEKHGIENCYVLNDFIVSKISREFITPYDFISYVLTSENISLIKVGKNLLNNMITSYDLLSLDDLDLDNENFITFLDDFLNPNKYLYR